MATKRVEAEQRAMLFSATTTLVFLTSWSLVADASNATTRTSSTSRSQNGRGRQYQQYHFASRVSHFDEGEQVGEKERRAADKESREALKLQLFGLGAAAPDRSEERALELGKELIQSIEQGMEPLIQNNKVVRLSGSEQGLKATTTVRASVTDIAAFLHDFESAYFTEAAVKDFMVRDRYKIEDGPDGPDSPGGGRSHTSYLRCRIPTGRYRDRVVCAKNTVSSLSLSGDVTYVSFPTKHEDVPEEDTGEIVFAESSWVYRIKPVRFAHELDNSSMKYRGPITTLELYTHLDFKTGAKSKRHFRYWHHHLYRPLTVRAVSQVQRYFQHLRPLENLDYEDGTSMATLLLDSVSAFEVGTSWGNRAKMGRLALSVMMEKNDALREVHARNPWFSPMCVSVLKSKTSPPRTVNKKLQDLSAADGVKVGKSLISFIITNTSARAAVDEFILKYPSMREYDRQNEFFRTFLETIATHTLKSATFGMKFRVMLGASLSTMDMVTDVFVINSYFKSGESSTASVMLLLLLLNVLFQLMLVFIQTRKAPRKVMAKEILLTLCGLKHARNAYRVAMDERRDYELLSPIWDLLLTVLGEVFSESIPAAIVLGSSILSSITSGNAISPTTPVSIFFTIVATSYTLASISYDLDVNPNRRRLDPQVYGYVPDKNRTRVLLAMTMFSTSVMVSAVFLYSVLVSMSGEAAFLYWCVSTLLYITRRSIRRGGFHPFKRKLSTGITCVLHVVGKGAQDFTAALFFAYPQGGGGAGFILNLAFNQMATVVVAILYVNRFGGLSGIIWNNVLAANGAVALSFLTLISTMDREHLSFFSSLETFGDQAERLFFTHTEHELKLRSAFDFTTLKNCERIRDEVKSFFQENIDDWNREQPLWWTPRLVAKIPDDMLDSMFAPNTTSLAVKRNFISRKASGRLKIRDAFVAIYDDDDDYDDEEEETEEAEEAEEAEVEVEGGNVNKVAVCGLG
ncbi:hypothetical protein TrST_g370 [Triparma strigata]|uniref:Uncharacterized protein n=1 Tax=Triparma strigata TaxID=1606541 RepID=A0A9W7A1P4_9STRA|nr:hypothetical protein TrST_g370 [Triparma strigata]